MTPMSLPPKKRATHKQRVAMKAMLRGLLGTHEFEKLCLGMKVGSVEDNILQIIVPTTESATDIRLHHLEDFAVAAEYGFLLPVRMVNVVRRRKHDPATSR